MPLNKNIYWEPFWGDLNRQDKKNLKKETSLQVFSLQFRSNEFEDCYYCYDDGRGRTRQTPNAAQFLVAADVVIVSFRKPDKNQFQNKTKKFEDRVLKLRLSFTINKRNILTIGVPTGRPLPSTKKATQDPRIHP